MFEIMTFSTHWFS